MIRDLFGTTGGDLVLLLNFIAVCVAIYKLGRAMATFENIGKQQAKEIGGLQESVKTMNELVTKMAVSTERQDSFQRQLDFFRKQMDDLARGEGFKLPHPFDQRGGLT